MGQSPVEWCDAGFDAAALRRYDGDSGAEQSLERASLVTPSPKGGSIRLRDVADAAGVDISVVSRVLNGDPKLSIRPATRQRIIDAAAELGYRPNNAARILKSARTMTIGLLLPDLFNAALAIAEGAEERAAETGYVLWIATGSLPERLSALEGRIDGLLIASATSQMIPRPDANLPMLLVNRNEAGSGIPGITVDDHAGAALAADYLISLGHRHIAHVAGPQSTDTARRRKAGFVEAAARAGVSIPDEWVVEAPFSESGGYSAATRLADGEDRPTAIFVSNITQSVGALAAVRRLGWRIPEDISIVGYDDVTLATYLDPPLTTVRMPLRELGSLAVDQMLALIEGRDVKDLTSPIPPELVVRGSSGPPA